MLIRPLLAAALAAFCLASPSTATTVLNLSPAQVDTLAQRIIEGRCVSSRVTTVPGTSTPATEYVFAVERVVKDASGGGLVEQVRRDGGRLLVRQLGGADASGGAHIVVGMPRYVVGQRYRLALNGESQLGLTSPVGMGQGVARLADEAPPATATATTATTGPTAPTTAPKP